ncbi:MAG: hypothetical protein OEZ25_06240 [Candidatus Bathyarchaeota archaeon]|nr:hypothetical protein [Candidatus Bathyarchaeota archaeon]
MNMKRIGAILVLCLLGFTLFTIPASVTADGWRRERYPVEVTVKGNLTLTGDPGTFNIFIQSNFTAMVPTQLAHGNYTGLFSGEAHVSNETIKFRGSLTVNESEFDVSFTVPNTYPEIPLSGEEEHEHHEYHGCYEEYEADGELEITISQVSAVPKEKTWVKIKGYVNSYGGQPAFGWLKAHAKFGEWAKVHAFFMPGDSMWGDGEWGDGEHSFRNANVTVEGNLTLTCASESFDITIDANFTARVPEEIESGNYTASYEGWAYVTNDTVQFKGELSVVDEEFLVEFTIPNTYPDLPKEYCTASGELAVIITRLPVARFEFALYMVRLVNASMVELNYSGNDFYISGLWDVYNITWAYSDEDNFNMTVKPVVVNGTGEFNVTNGWKDFTLDITGVELIGGKVFFLCYRSFVVPPGDVNDDYIVDIFDLVHIGKRYGTTPGIAEFDFDLDFNDDFEIDIYDLTTIGANLGEEY